MRARRSSGASGIADVLAVAFLVTLSLARFGNALEEVAMYLPFVRSLAGTWPAPPDQHIEVLRRMPLAWCRVAAFFEARGCLLEALLAGVVLGRVALAAACLALGAAIAGRGPGRYACAFLCLLAPPYGLDPARFVLLHAEALPACLATPLSIGALVLAARRRPVLGGALLGLAANLHPVVAFAGVPPFLVALSPGEPVQRVSAWARGLAAAGLVALPTAVFVLTRAAGATLPRAEVAALVKTVTGAHLFFTGFDSGTWAAFLVLAALALAVPRALARRRRALAAAGLAGLAVAAAGLALADVLPFPLGLELCPARSAVFTKAIALAFVGALACRRRPGLDPLDPLSLGAALVVGGILESTLVAALGAALVAFAHVRASRSLAGYAALPLAAGGLLLAPRDGGEVVPALAVALAVLLLGLVAAGLSRRAAAWVLGLGVALASVLAHHLVLVSGPQGVGLSVRWAALSAGSHARGAAERQALGDFLARATPTDARLLAPPEERLLPYLAGRSVVASAQWATLAPWDPGAGKLEVAALDAIGYRFGDLARGQAYHAWAPARILDAARSLGASHVVVDRTLGDPALGPVLYENARYRVYAVGAP
jgi:hypothetical protein